MGTGCKAAVGKINAFLERNFSVVWKMGEKKKLKIEWKMQPGANPYLCPNELPHQAAALWAHIPPSFHTPRVAIIVESAEGLGSIKRTPSMTLSSHSPV